MKNKNFPNGTRSNANHHHPKSQDGCSQNSESKNKKNPAPSYVYKDMSNIKAPPNYRCLIRWDPENSFQPLPVKLDAMLSDPDLSAIISFLPHGRSWRIINRKQMAKFVLPRYFDHSNLDSFLRLVNAWGFRRVPSGVDRDSYYHELFLRGMPHLHTEMKRLTRDQAKAPVLLEDQCPNFYEMPPLPEASQTKDDKDAKNVTPHSNDNKAETLLLDTSVNPSVLETNNFKMHAERGNSETSSLTDDPSDSTPVPLECHGNNSMAKTSDSNCNRNEMAPIALQSIIQPPTLSVPIQNQNLQTRPVTMSCGTQSLPLPLVFSPNRNQTVTFQHLQFPSVYASGITPSLILQLPRLHGGAQQSFATCNQSILQFTPPTVGQQLCNNIYSTAFPPNPVTTTQQPNLYSAGVSNLLHQLASLIQSNVSPPTSSHRPSELDDIVTSLMRTQQPNAGHNLVDNQTRHSTEIALQILGMAAKQQGEVSDSVKSPKP